MAIVSKRIIEKAALKLSISKKLKSLRYSFLDALSNDFNELLNLISQLIKAYRSTPKEERKEFGIESLKIFNLNNDKGQTIIILAAEHGRADLLKEWYRVPESLTDYKCSPEELQEVYKQRISSYTAQDNEGNNALMHATRSGNSKCFPFLLSPETAITMNQKNKNGDTPLALAVKSKNFELIKEFLSVIKEILGKVNQYDIKSEVKLEICSDTSKCIQSIKDENIKSLITKFISRSEEHITAQCRIPFSSLKRKNTDQANGTSEKKRKEGGETIATVQERIQGLIDKLEQRKDHVGPELLVSVRTYISNIAKLAKNADLTSDDRSEVYQKLEKLEEKLQEAGKAKLEELLNMAGESNLTNERKEKIVDHIKKLVIEVKIKIPENIMRKVTIS